MYQVVDSNGTVLQDDFPNKIAAKEFRKEHPGSMLQRMATHPKGASHLPPPPKPKFNKVAPVEADGEPAEVVTFTDEELDAEAMRLDGYGYKTASGSDVPIWKQQPEFKPTKSMTPPPRPAVIDMAADPI